MKLSRRTVLRGAGVTMALPWLESLSAFAATPSSSPFPEALRRALHGQRRQREPLGRHRVGRRHEARPEPVAARAAEEEGQRHQRALQQALDRPGHPPRADGKPALGSADHARAGHSRRHHRRPDDRQSRRPGNAAAEHRPGLRAADDGLPRDEFLDGVQLAHLVAERRLAGAQRGLPRARVRHAVREPRQRPQPQHSRPREGQRRAAEPPGELDRPAQARRVHDERARSGEARRRHAEEPGKSGGPREAEEPAGVLDGPAGERAARRSSRAHAADVRRHRARVSDRQDARRVAAARARPVGALLPVPRRA